MNPCEVRRRRGETLAAVCGWVTLLGLSCSGSPVAAQSFRVATFAVDITPPPGSPLCGGWITPLVAVDDPLLGKGVILDDGRATYVLCALDWCEVRNRSHREMRDRLAAAVGTAPSHVAVQCLHQHDAPVIDRTAQQLIDATGHPLPLFNVPAYEGALTRLAAAAADAVGRLTPCNRIAWGSAPVERVASTRRVPGPEGSILVRYSLTTDLDLRAADEGLIDPLVRTVSFLAGDRPLVRLHYYATHPQSFYGQGRATCDFPGLARETLEREEKVPQIYFTGCAGDVTASKYNDGTLECRRELADRLAAGMRRAIADSRNEVVGPVHWRAVAANFPLRSDSPYTEADAQAFLNNADASSQDRLNRGALLASLYERKSYPIEFCSWQIGAVHVLHLPGEPSVEFQLGAQRLLPTSFVAVAGYGDGGPGYLCLERHFAEGGYEPSASLVGPRSEQILTMAISHLLGLGNPPAATPEPHP